MNDIDAGVTEEWVGGQGFHPIGDGGVGLRGGLYGDGYAIRNLWINRPSLARVGLFAVVDGGVIESVGIEDARIVGFYYVGALVGEQIKGAIQNAWASGDVRGDDGDVGGLVGRNRGGMISESRSLATVTGEDVNIGGLIGYSSGGDIVLNWSSGLVRGGRNVGGLVGRHEEAAIARNWSIAAVTAKRMSAA